MKGLQEQHVSLMLKCSGRHVRRLKQQGLLRFAQVNRNIFFLRADVVDYMEGNLDDEQFKTVKEISRELGIPPSTIYSAVKDNRVRFKISATKQKYKVYLPDCRELSRPSDSSKEVDKLDALFSQLADQA